MTAWVALAILAAIGAAQPSPAPRIYSDICTEPQSGDISGHEIDMSGPASTPKVRFFWSEGSIMSPLDASDVVRAGRRISFVVRGEEGMAVFRGHTEATRLVGRLRDFGQSKSVPVDLPLQPVKIALPPCGRAGKKS